MPRSCPRRSPRWPPRVARWRVTPACRWRTAPDRARLDLTYQLVGIAFGLVPVVLALYLLQLTDPPAGERIGFDLHRPVFDLGRGLLLAAAIGIPGLALYFGAREIGLNTEVRGSGLAENW